MILEITVQYFEFSILRRSRGRIVSSVLDFFGKRDGVEFGLFVSGVHAVLY